MKYIALVGKCPDEAFSTLSSHPEVERVFRLPPDKVIDSPIASHPDTILCIYKNKLYCHESYAESNGDLLSEICMLCGLELCPQDGERSGKYPHDCSFNALVSDDLSVVIGRKASLCSPLSQICENVNQGYAACSSLFAKDTVLTDDPSVISALERLRIKYYRICGDDIILDGYDRGFIGGCGGVIGERIYLFGKPELSDAGRSLMTFCKEYGYETVSLCRGPLTDHGGIKFVPIKTNLS